MGAEFPGAGGGGGAPSGPAGGVLGGTFPNPSFAVDMATQAELDAVAAAKQPLDSDLTAIAALSPSNDDVVQRKAGAWTNRSIAQLATDLGLASGYQPLDSDLTAIAALATTSYGRSVLTQADAAALRTLAGLGTAATQATSAFDAAGAAAAAQAASQPLDSDLTAIAALTTTAFGRSLLAAADAAALRVLAGVDLTLLAPLASPALTGNPTVPTQTAGNNSTRAASTAYADGAVATEASRATAAEGLLVPKSLVTAKGDLVGATASGVPARVAAGTDGAPLIADSSQTPGVRWGGPTTPASWPFGAFVSGVPQQNNTSRELILYVTARLQPTAGTTQAEVDMSIGPTSGTVVLCMWALANYVAGAANDEYAPTQLNVPPGYWVQFNFTAASMGHLAYRYAS